MADQINNKVFDLVTRSDNDDSLFEDLIVPRQESGRSKQVEAFGSSGYFDFDVEPKKGDYGDMHLWVEPSRTNPDRDESYWRYLEKKLAGGRWELSGQSDEYDAYYINPKLIKAHWGDSEVGQKIRDAVLENIKWEDLPQYLQDYNTWRSISPDRDLDNELKILNEL